MPLEKSSHDVDAIPVHVGDRVVVLGVPDSVIGLARDAIDAFSRALGRSFRVAGIDDTGSFELELFAPRFKGLHTIWVEGHCVRRIGRSFVRPSVPRSRYIRGGTSWVRLRFNSPQAFARRT
jgi:hypothetical protein